MKDEHNEIVAALKESGMTSHRVVGRGTVTCDVSELRNTEKFKNLQEKASKIVGSEIGNIDLEKIISLVGVIDITSIAVSVISRLERTCKEKYPKELSENYDKALSAINDLYNSAGDIIPEHFWNKTNAN